MTILEYLEIQIKMKEAVYKYYDGFTYNTDMQLKADVIEEELKVLRELKNKCLKKGGDRKW